MKMKVHLSAAATMMAGLAAVTGATVSPAATEAHNAAQAAAPTVNLELQTSSPQLAKCFPHADVDVNVALTTDTIGKDTFKITASGLRPKTDFTVFLLEKARAPFGAAEYIGDFTTDQWGKASNTYQLIVQEAFAFNNEQNVRTELNSVGFWFADKKDDDGCLGVNSPETRFDGDDSAGVQMMNSGAHLLP
jgi:hypothetical protein